MNEYKIIYTLYNDKTITSSEKEFVVNYYGLSLDEESAIDFVKKKIGLNDENDIFTLNKIIKINPNIKNYVETINNLYADLDFIHTILENNSVDIYNLLEELCIDLEYNKGTKNYIDISVKNNIINFKLNYINRSDLDSVEYKFLIAKKIAYLYLYTTFSDLYIGDYSYEKIDIESLEYKNIKDESVDIRKLNSEVIDFGLILLYPDFLYGKYANNFIDRNIKLLNSNKELMQRRLHVFNNSKEN